MENLVDQSNVLFVLLGAIMVLAMHAGFAFFRGWHCEGKKSG